MKKTTILTIFFILLIIPMPVNALFPNSHAYIIHKICEKGYDSDLARMCCRDVDLCTTGTILTDISVIYYLEKGLKKYTVTHSSIFCHDVLAQARTPEEETVASGMCLHHPVDIIAHNKLVTYSIRHTALPNYLIHPFAEQKVDNYVLKLDPNSKKYVQDSMELALEYVPFIQRVLQPNTEYGDVDVRQLTIGFIEQLRVSKSGYDVSFNTVKAIPKIIYIIIILFMLLCFTGVFFLVRKRKRTIINIITASVLLLIGLLFIMAIIGTFTGSLWTMFTAVAKPVSIFVPTPSPNMIIQDSEDLTSDTLKYGIGFLDTLPPDMRDVTGIIVLLLLVGLFTYLNIRK